MILAVDADVFTHGADMFTCLVRSDEFLTMCASRPTDNDSSFIV